MHGAPSDPPPLEDADRRLGLGARGLLFALAFAPALLCAQLVATRAVNIPVWDDWERGRLVERWQNGTLDFAFLYSPHIDHRIVVPRLVALANAKWFGGDLRLEMGLAFLVVLATALAVHALLRRTLGPRPAAVCGATLLANLLLFTPLQWENLLWAAQPFFLLPLGALVAALLALGSGLSLPARFSVCLALALVASHTFSHGLVLWPVVLAYVVLARDFGPPRARLAFLAGWSLAALAVLVPYFTVGGFRSTSLPTHTFGLETGERVPRVALAEALEDPLRVVRFFFGMLGSLTGRLPYFTPARAALWAGVALAAFFALSLGLWLSRWRDARVWDRGLPWVTLGGVALGMAALAAVGRTAMRGWEYSILPHYISIALYVPLATVALSALALERLRGARAPGPLPAVAVGMAAALLVWGWGVGVAGMDEWRSARLQARTSLHYVQHIKPRERWRLDGSTEVVRAQGAILDRHGQLDPPLARDLGLEAFELRDELLTVDEAGIERVFVEDGRVIVTGFAWLVGPARRADGVLLVARDAPGAPRVVTVAELRGLPVVHIAAHEHAFNYVNLPDRKHFGAFEGRILPAQLPDQPLVELEAFAVDAERMRLHPLGDRVRVRHGGGRLTAELVRAVYHEELE